MYAERKGIDLGQITVKLRHEKIHAQDCEDCESKSGMLDQISTGIHFGGDLDAAQTKRLLEIAAKCPVHRTLSSEVKIRTTMG